MRILLHRHASQLRLGWLRVIAQLYEDKPLSRDELAQRLFAQAETQQFGWLEEAGIVVPPRGLLHKDGVRRLIRMADNFGIYDPAAERLTDMGITLREAAATVRCGPFSWTTGLRFLGLRILLGVDGDLLLAVIQQWSATEPLDDDVAHVARCAKSILWQAKNEEEREALHHLIEPPAERTDARRRFREGAIYPTLEPLRELGYLERRPTGKPGQYAYALTPKGARLKVVIGDVDDISSFLSRDFTHGFLFVEEIAPKQEASPVEVGMTLSSLPRALLGGLGQEAPLEPVLLLTQFRLLSSDPGVWLELEQSTRQLKAISQTQDRIRLKQGAMTWESNITWSDSSDLTDKSLWCLPGEKVSQVDPSNSLMPSEAAMITLAPPLPDELIAARCNLLGILGSRQASLTPKRRAWSARELIWLQYVARLLEPPTLGGVRGLAVGGVWSWLGRLQRLAEKDNKYLAPKRKAGQLKDPLGSFELGRWLDGVDGQDGIEALVFVRFAWADLAGMSQGLLATALRDAQKEAESLPIFLDKAIEKYLKSPSLNDEKEKKEWQRITNATRALINDRLDRNLVLREEVRSRLYELAATGQESEVAIDLLHYISDPGQERMLRVVQTLQVSLPIKKYIASLTTENRQFNSNGVEIEFVVSAGERDPDCTQAEVSLLARTRELAIVRAREYVWNELKRLRFRAATSLVDPSGTTDEEGIAYPQPRVIDADGNDVPARQSAGPLVSLYALAQFPRRAPPSQDLPSGSPQASDGVATAAERLSKTLHWLSAADQPSLLCIHRISNVWIAVEHLVERDEDHGDAVAEALADVGVLCRLEALGGELCREICAALRRSHIVHPSDTAVKQALQDWSTPIQNHLGTDVWASITQTDLLPSAPISDIDGFKVVVGQLTKLRELASTIESVSPIVSWRLRQFYDNISRAESLYTWLRGIRYEISSLVHQVYEIRNQIFHDGATFSMDEAAHLEELYAVFRVLLDAVMVRVVTSMNQHGSQSPMAQIWSRLRIGLRQILHWAERTAKKKQQDAVTDDSTDVRYLLRYVLQAEHT